MPLSEEARVKARAREKAWKKANPEKVAAQNKRGRKKHPERAARLERGWRERDAVKVAARKAVQCDVREGRLVRGPCEIGDDCEGRIEAHHDDYSKPREVRWLCDKHHRAHHKAMANVPV